MPLATDVEFRPAEPGDRLCIGVLATQVFLDTYATDGLRPDLAREALNNYCPATFDARIRDSANHVLLAERAGHLVAFSECCSSPTPPMPVLCDGVQLTSLYVQRRWQRLGIGAALVAKAEARAEACGARVLWLTVWVGNSNARAFYAAQGYQDVGSATYAFEEHVYENRIYSKRLQTKR